MKEEGRGKKIREEERKEKCDSKNGREKKEKKRRKNKLSIFLETVTHNLY
jgi:hypothetical protein